MKRVYEAGNLPATLQDELRNMLQALDQKYGSPAVELGVYIENLAQVCNMLQRDFSPADREAASRNARKVCYEVITALGRAMRVDPESAFAVARAMAEFTEHAGESLFGERPFSADVTDEAAAVIKKAAAPTLH